MKSKNRKKAWFVLCIGILIFIGCGTKNDDTKTKIVYWSMWNSTEPQALALQDAIDDFMEKNPTVIVDVNWNGREIRKTLQPALDNGQKIDLWDEDIERVVKSYHSYALSLDDYVKQTYETTAGVPYENAVMSNLLELTRYFAKDGSLYAIPYQPFLFAFMYNKTHFEKAGIAQAPTTWEEFLAACDSLQKAGFVPITTDDAYVVNSLGYHLARLKGSAWVEQLVNDESRELWNDDAVLRTAQDFEELADKGYFSETVGSNKWPAGQQDVAAGSVSMYLNGTWLVNEIMASTGPDFQWGTFAYPVLKGGTDDLNAGHYGAQAFQINKNSENPEIVFRLIVHVTTGKWDSVIAERSFGVPVSKDGQWPVQLREAKAVFDMLDTVYPGGGGILSNVDVVPIIAEAFTNLISGKLDAEGFVEAVRN